MTENNITPDISVTFAQNAEILSIAYHGWKIDQSIIPLQFPSQDSLSWLINKLEGYKLCTGTEHSTKNTWIHFVQTWENDHVQNKQCIRSPSCLIIVSDENKEQKCKTCCVYERKTVHNKKSNLAGTTPNNQCDSTDVDEELKTPNPWLQLFNAQQEQNREREKSGRRYHPDIIRWCIEMYARSAAAYNHLRVTKVVVLPSATTLRTYRNMVTPKPGLNQVAIDEIKRLGGNIDAYLTLDEMKIRENLVYRNGKVTGMVDFGDRTSVDKLASHICVIYLRSFHKTISLPLSWFPTTTTPAFQLCSTFWEAVGICESNGVRIHAVVADGASTNRKFFELLAGKFSSDTKEFYGCINSYDTSRKILIFSDFCHLLKTTRNGLYSSKPSGTKYFNKSGKDILWSHIVSLYNLDNAKLLGKTRLSNLHMLLNPYNKMKVDIARQTLSHNVACAALEDIEGANGTAEFIQLFHKVR